MNSYVKGENEYIYDNLLSHHRKLTLRDLIYKLLILMVKFYDFDTRTIIFLNT